MSLSYSIEQALIVSVIEHQYIQNDKEILKVPLDPNVFSDPFHKIIVKSINKIKEKNLPIDTDFIRDGFIQANKWNIDLDNRLIEIMIHTPLGTIESFIKYYNALKNMNFKHNTKRFAV